VLGIEEQNKNLGDQRVIDTLRVILKYHNHEAATAEDDHGVVLKPLPSDLYTLGPFLQPQYPG
jgi:hypothetical protein